MRLIFAVLMFFSMGPWGAWADGLENFISGQYVLISGEEHQCGDGLFQYHSKGEYVTMGPYHGFDTGRETNTYPSDIPELKGCVHHTQNSRRINGSTTVITFVDVLKCKEGLRHNMRQETKITNDQISLSVKTVTELEDEPVFNYSCVWSRQKPK